jgi:hypothetical protein
LGWYSVGVIYTLEITLSNGESCTAGSYYEVDDNHTFDPNKKITKVECIIHKDEWCILRMNFYSGQETLVRLGDRDDWIKEYGGRVEIFEIAADEQLIGAELYHGYYDNNDCDYLRGVTWLKCKIAK